MRATFITHLASPLAQHIYIYIYIYTYAHAHIYIQPLSFRIKLKQYL